MAKTTIRSFLLAGVFTLPLITAHAQVLNANNNNGGSNGNGNANSNLNSNRNFNTNLNSSLSNSSSAAVSGSRAVTGASTSNAIGGNSASNAIGGSAQGGTGMGGNASLTGNTTTTDTTFKDVHQTPAIIPGTIVQAGACPGGGVSGGLGLFGQGAVGSYAGLDDICREQRARGDSRAEAMLCHSSDNYAAARDEEAMDKRDYMLACYEHRGRIAKALEREASATPAPAVQTVAARPVADVADRYAYKPDWCGTWSAGDGPLPSYCR